MASSGILDRLTERPRRPARVTKLLESATSICRRAMPDHDYPAIVAALNDAHRLAPGLHFGAKGQRTHYEAGQASRLVRDLDDPDPAVVEATTAALDGLIWAHPQALAELTGLVTWNAAVRASLHRYLLHVGTPEALTAVILALDANELDEEWNVLAGLIGEATAMLPDERFEAMLEGPEKIDGPQRRMAGTILTRRGSWRAAEILFEDFPSATLVREWVASHGQEGIRHVCRAASRCPDASALVARPLAELREKTEATVYELAEDPASKADRVAACVLGHWEHSRAVETLIRIAKDRARTRQVQEAALESLCALEAVEAIELLTGAVMDPLVGASTRLECIDVLGQIGNFTAVGVLEAASTSDRDGPIGERARRAVANIRGSRRP